MLPCFFAGTYTDYIMSKLMKHKHWSLILSFKPLKTFSLTLLHLCPPLKQCQDHQEHCLRQPGADCGAVEEEVREGEREEQDPEGHRPEAGS